MTAHAAFAPVSVLRIVSDVSYALSSAVAAMVTSWKHRAALRQLADADDRMLADIGLLRADLRDAASLSPFRDPTSLLVARAVERRAARPRSISGPRILPAPTLVPDVTTETSIAAHRG